MSGYPGVQRLLTALSRADVSTSQANRVLTSSAIWGHKKAIGDPPKTTNAVQHAGDPPASQPRMEAAADPPGGQQSTTQGAGDQVGGPQVVSNKTVSAPGQQPTMTANASGQQPTMTANAPGQQPAMQPILTAAVADAGKTPSSMSPPVWNPGVGIRIPPTPKAKTPYVDVEALLTEFKAARQNVPDESPPPVGPAERAQEIIEQKKAEQQKNAQKKK